MPKFTLWLKLFTSLYVFTLITGTFKVSRSHNGGYRIQVPVIYLMSGYIFFGYDSQSRDLWNENIICHSHTDCAMVKQARKPKQITQPRLSSSRWESVTLL